MYSRVALRALLRRANRIAAVVAFEALAAFVIGERDAAILALHERAATAAEQRPRIAAAIDEHHGLRALFEAQGDGRAQRLGNGRGAMLAAKFLAQIHDANFRERAVFHARRELEQLIFSGAGVVVGFKRRRGRAEQRDRAFEARAVDGGVAPVVARRFFLLVAGFLLFVDDDEAEIFERRENRGARAHNDARLAVANAPPFAGAFDIREAAVQNGDNRAEARADQPAEPERERDFRNQDDRGFSARKRRFDRAQIDFRFAAARDAVKQAGRKFARHNPAPDFSERFFLFGVQDVGGRSEIRVPGIFVRGERLFPGEQAPVFSRRCTAARDAFAFASSNGSGSGAPRGGEHFADSGFGFAGSDAGFRATIRGAVSSGGFGFQATIFCVRVFRGLHNFARRQIAAANEFFGGGFASGPYGARAPAVADCRFSKWRSKSTFGILECRSISLVAATSCRCARPESVSEYSRSWRSSISGGSMARKASPTGAR